MNRFESNRTFFPCLALIALLYWGVPTLKISAEDSASTLPHFVVGSPNGLHDLVAYPDQWSATRAVTDELLCSGASFSNNSDEELQKWFAQLAQWNMKLELEVGAVKEWSGQTGRSTFDKEKPMWERIQKMGGKITSIAMDEPLSCTRRLIKKPDDYALTETVNFIALVQQNFPDIKIIEIEPYPSIPLADHKIWIDSLQKKLAEKKLKPLYAYRLDVDSMNFTLRNEGSWKEVRDLETYCHGAKLPFSLIYWSAGYGYWDARHLADDSTWYTGLMSMGYDYAAVGGKPDQVVIESWVRAPKVVVPETGEFTFTRSVLDFYNKFVRPPATATPK